MWKRVDEPWQQYHQMFQLGVPSVMCTYPHPDLCSQSCHLLHPISGEFSPAFSVESALKSRWHYPPEHGPDNAATLGRRP